MRGPAAWSNKRRDGGRGDAEPECEGGARHCAGGDYGEGWTLTQMPLSEGNA